jgi:hypothetical protein
MAINDATIQVERTSRAPKRVPARNVIAIGVPALVVAIMALVAFVPNSGRESVRPTPQPAPQSRDEIIRDLVDRGHVPSQTLQPAPQSRDEIVRDLVHRGLVPAATLND